MKTLAELKRDIKVGDSILIENIFDIRNDEPIKVEIPETMQGIRKVSYIDTTGFYLKKLNDDSNRKGSFCKWVKAKNLEYENDTFSISEHGDKRVYKIIN